MNMNYYKTYLFPYIMLYFDVCAALNYDIISAVVFMTNMNLVDPSRIADKILAMRIKVKTWSQ